MFLHRMSKYILKEVLFTLIMFNMFNISFSIGLQLKYVGEVQPVAIICLLVSIAIIFGIILALLKADKL